MVLSQNHRHIRIDALFKYPAFVYNVGYVDTQWKKDNPISSNNGAVLHHLQLISLFIVDAYG